MKKRILVCGDSFKRISGLSYIALNLLKYFKNKNYEVAYCVISGTKDSIVSPKDIEDKGHFFYEYLKDEMLFNSQIELKETYNIFDQAIEHFKPHIVFSVHDIWRLDKIAFNEYRDTYKWIHYAPIESSFYFTHIVYPTEFNKEYRKSLKGIVEQMDLIIPYTEMGKQVLYSLSKENDIDKITDSVYNGIDLYYEDKSEINRQEIFRGLVKDDDFVFMTVGGNFARKGLNYVIEAFYMFLKQVENPKKYKLYIHGYLDTLNSGTDLKSMMYSLGILDNCIMCKDELISKRELYQRYKACDCYIGLPLAEGFGLGYSEALLNKLPIIYHNFGGHTEYLHNIGIPVNSVANYHPTNQFAIWKIPDVIHCKNIMLELVKMYKSSEIKKRVNEGYEFAKNNLTWDNIYSKFDNILDAYIEKNIKVDNIFNNITIRKII